MAVAAAGDEAGAALARALAKSPSGSAEALALASLLSLAAEAAVCAALVGASLAGTVMTGGAITSTVALAGAGAGAGSEAARRLPCCSIWLGFQSRFFSASVASWSFERMVPLLRKGTGTLVT